MDDKQVENIFKKVLDNLRSKVDELDRKGQGYYAKLQDLQSKLNTHLRKSCANEIEWFNKNGQVQEAEQGMNFSINKGVDEKEAQKRMDEFTACARKNDFGVEKFLQDVSSQQQKINEENEGCIGKCMENKKDVGIFQECITKCFSTTLDDLSRSFDTIDGKVGEVNRKI
jgi:hypothetical protein